MKYIFWLQDSGIGWVSLHNRWGRWRATIHCLRGLLPKKRWSSAIVSWTYWITFCRNISRPSHKCRNRWPWPSTTWVEWDKTLNTGLWLHEFCRSGHPHQSNRDIFSLYSSVLAWGFSCDPQGSILASIFTTDNELGMPVKRPEAITRLMGKVYMSLSSY